MSLLHNIRHPPTYHFAIPDQTWLSLTFCRGFPGSSNASVRGGAARECCLRFGDAFALIYYTVPRIWCLLVTRCLGAQF